MDELDQRIVRELQRDASQSMAALAERVGSTPATCHRRYQKLRKAGYIRRIVALADPKISPDALTVVIGVKLKDQRTHGQRAVQDFVHSHPQVIMAWMTSGEFDYVVVGAFVRRQDYMEFLEKELQALPALDRYQSFLVIDELKFQPGQPL